jgi:ornithine carbamoyltransferase
MDLAYKEARQLNSSYIGTEHLLFGLILEGEGLAARVLVELGADLERTRHELQALQAEDPGAGVPFPEPWQVLRSRAAAPRTAPYTEGYKMWQRFTERARRVIFSAQEEAARLGESYVGTEHLLLGLARESDSVAGRILERLRVPAGRVRAEVEKQITRGRGSTGQDMQLTPRAKRVIDLAYEEARQLNNNYIGTEHLLLGLVREFDGLAARVLLKLGADLERIRREVRAMQEREITPTTSDTEKADPALRWLWELPYSHLRRLAEYTRSERNPAGAASAAMVAVDLARNNCSGLTDLREIGDLSRDQAWAILSLARVLKDTLAINKTAHREILPGRTLAMIFEKPSLRTRVSFETGMYQLGGHALYLAPADIAMGKRESIEDVARNLERMVNGIMARVFAHQTVLDLAQHSTVPVINGLSDREHPCQALADLLTVWERRNAIEGQRITYVGDGNNVAHSLLLLGAKLGAHITIACPEGYDPDPELVAASRREAATTNGSVTLSRDAREACTGADVIYTDIWASMGQEGEAEERARSFTPFQINEELVSVARADYHFLHCLPAHRGEEVTEGVIDGPNSVVFDQAENRLHVQKAVLAVLLG